MSIIAGIITPLAKLIDKIIPDPEARDRAKLELLRLEGSQEMETLKAQMAAIIAEASSTDPWTSRARPSFLYVMYALLLWAIPMGLIAAARPDMAEGIATGMNAYLAGLPEPLYALFGTRLPRLHRRPRVGKIKRRRITPQKRRGRTPPFQNLTPKNLKASAAIPPSPAQRPNRRSSSQNWGWRASPSHPPSGPAPKR